MKSVFLLLIAVLATTVFNARGDENAETTWAKYLPVADKDIKLVQLKWMEGTWRRTALVDGKKKNQDSYRSIEEMEIMEVGTDVRDDPQGVWITIHAVAYGPQYTPQTRLMIYTYVAYGRGALCCGPPGDVDVFDLSRLPGDKPNSFAIRHQSTGDVLTFERVPAPSADPPIPYEELVGRWRVVDWSQLAEPTRPTVHLLREFNVYLPFFTGPPLPGKPLEEHAISAELLIDEGKGMQIQQGSLENSLGVSIVGHKIRAGPPGVGFVFDFAISSVNGEPRLELRDRANRFVFKKAGPPPDPPPRGIYPPFKPHEIQELWKLWREWWKENPPKKPESSGSR